MPEAAKISIYSVNRCGYYRHGTPDPVFGKLNDVMSQLQTWAKRANFPLSDTCTYAVPADGDVLRTFCFDIVNNTTTGDYFLTTWNETPSTQGKVPSVSGNQPVGAAQVHLNGIVDGTIPGYATYFWFIPQANKLATVRFHHLLNGQKNLTKYMRGFLERHSNHAVLEQLDDNNAEVTGYKVDANADAEPLIPSFRAQLLRKAGELELIKERRPSIRKVIRKSILDMEVKEEQNLLEKMMLKLGITAPQNNQTNHLDVKYSFNYNPSAEELEDIFEHALEEGLSWTNDVGFQMTGNQEIIWLSNSVVKHELNLEIEKDNDEIVNLNSLAEQLTHNRQMILNIINSVT